MAQSRTVQQDHEDTRWMRPFRPAPSARRQSIELENGSIAKHERTSKANTGGRLGNSAGFPQPETTSGIPFAAFTTHHLPAGGTPLRVRNDPEDSWGHSGFGAPAEAPKGQLDNPFEIHQDPTVQAVRPGVSDTARLDDQAALQRRAENLLRASQRASRSAKENLFYPIYEREDKTKAKKYVLNVATLQAAAINYYQTLIAECAARMWKGGVPYDDMPEILHRYCEALRDMDYMQDKARLGFDNDPFLLMTTKQMEREILFDSGLVGREELASTLPSASDKHNPVLPGVGRTARFHATEAKARTINLMCALLGGLALIVPMIIMTLIPSQMCVLITTTAFVLVFASVIALLSGLRPNEVLAVTAGYAAVLVVFVGAQSGNTTTSIAR